ncbi:MAG: DinB family protein [Thermoanaerobaculia bacterium]
MKLLCTLLLAAVTPILALAKTPQNAPKSGAKAQASAPANGFKAEFLTNLDEVQEKILELAESVPADKYNWRPGPDVRSTSEVFMHIAGGNYFLSTFLGMDPPKMNGDIEKVITRKADVIAELKRSFDHLRNAVAETSDLEKPVKMFGTQTTHRGVLVTILSHLHEHLGQSVAYARMNGIVPPWSR